LNQPHLIATGDDSSPSDEARPETSELVIAGLNWAEQPDARHPRTRQDTVLVVAGEAQETAALRRILRFAHYGALATTDLDEASTLATQAGLVILSVQLESWSVLGLVRTLRG
jgi:hypothetical protein